MAAPLSLDLSADAEKPLMDVEEDLMDPDEKRDMVQFEEEQATGNPFGEGPPAAYLFTVKADEDAAEDRVCKLMEASKFLQPSDAANNVDELVI